MRTRPEQMWLLALGGTLAALVAYPGCFPPNHATPSSVIDSPLLARRPSEPPSQTASTSLHIELSVEVAKQVQRLHSSDPDERGQACRTLRGMGQDASAAVPSLAKLLGDKTPWRTWTYLPKPGYVYGMHSQRPVGESASQALGAIGHESIPALVSAMKDESDFVRENAAQALTRFSDPRVESTMVESLRDKSALVRRTVAYGLRFARDRRTIAALITVLKDPVALVRGDAAQALGQTGDREAVIPLISLLDDPDQQVVALAAWALGQLKDPRAVAPLIRVLGQAKQPWPRMEVVGALGEIGDQRALGPLRNALTDQDVYVCQAAAKALKRFLSTTHPQVDG